MGSKAKAPNAAFQHVCYLDNTDSFAAHMTFLLLMQDDDELDAGEAFERMQLAQIVANNPDSAAYHAAMRKVGGAVRTASPGRFGGVKAQADAMRRRELEQAIAAGTVR